jgi:outer membrane protein assembly factor BamB
MKLKSRQKLCLGLMVVGLGLVYSSHVSAETPPATLQLSPTNLWRVDAGKNNRSAPALSPQGLIHVISGDGKLFAFTPDGKRKWVYSIGMESVSTPAIDAQGTIYFGARNQHLQAVNASGRRLWAFKTGGWVDASPALAAAGTIYCGSWDKKFYALNPEGVKHWEFATGGPVVSSAAIDADGAIYFGSHDRKLYALNPDGAKRWEFLTGGAIISSPAIGPEGEIYFTSTDGKLRVLENNGALRWEKRTGGINPASPVLSAEQTIYLGVNSNHCEFSATGELLWYRHMSPTGYLPFRWLVATPIALEGNLVLTAGTDLNLSVFERGGRGLWHVSMGAGIYAPPLLLDSGSLFAIATHGGLQAFAGLPPPAQSSWPMFRANAQRTGRVVTSSVR